MPEPTNNPDTPAPNPTATPQAATAMAAAMEKAFGPTGIIPVEDPKPTQPTPPEGATAAAPAPAPTPDGATGAPAATPPEPKTVAEKIAARAKAGDTGATGATGPAPEIPPTGDTGATGATGAAPTPEQLDKAAAGMDIKTGTAFKYVRHQLKEVEQGLNQSQTRIAELEAELAKRPAADDKTLTELQTKLAEAEKKVAAIDYQATEEYQSKVAAPLQAAEGALRTLAGKYNVEEKELAVALAEKDPAKRSDLLSDLSKDFNRIDMATFDRNVVSYDTLVAEKARVLQFAAETMENQRRQAEAARSSQVKNFTENWNKSLDATLADLSKENPIFAPTGDEKWDADLAARVAKVKSIDIARVPNEVLARALYRDQAFELIEGVVAELVSDLQASNEEVAKLRGGTPPAAGGSAPVVDPAGKQPIPETASFLDTIKSKLPGILPA